MKVSNKYLMGVLLSLTLVVWISSANAALVGENGTVQTAIVQVPQNVISNAPQQVAPQAIQMPVQQQVVTQPMAQMPVQAPAPVQYVYVPQQQPVLPSLPAPQPVVAAAAQAAPESPSIGSRIDEAVKIKLAAQQKAYEQKLVDKLATALMDDDAPAKVQGTALVTESINGAMPATPVANAQPVAQVGSSQMLTMSTSTVVTPINSDESEDGPSQVYVKPRGGIATTSNAAYGVKPRYAAGIAMGAMVSDFITFEVGYQYNVMGVTAAVTNPVLIQAYNLIPYNQGYGFSGENYSAKQNVVDLGLKLSFLGKDSKLRPYIGGGGAYTKAFVNYDTRLLSYLTQNNYTDLAKDYSYDAFAGFLNAGFDLKIAKTMSLNVDGKFYSVLSATETPRQNYGYNGYNGYNGYRPYNGYTPYNGYNGYNGYVNPYQYSATGMGTVDQDRYDVGNAISVASFYTITAGLTFVF